MVTLNEECSVILHKKLPPKLKDSGSFHIPCAIGTWNFDKVLCNLGVSVNLMSFSMLKKLGLEEAKPTTAYCNYVIELLGPRGVLDDVLVKMGNIIFPSDFIVLDMEEDQDIPIILGLPFFTMGKAIINVLKKELSLEVENKKVTFNVLRALKEPPQFESYCEIVTVDKSVTEKNLLKATEYL